MRWNLPGPQRLLSGVQAGLAAHQHMVLVLPDVALAALDGLVDAVRAAGRRTHQQLTVIERPTPRPVECLREAMQLRGVVVDAAEVAQHPDVHDLVLIDLTGIAERHFRRWARYLTRAAEALQAQLDRGAIPRPLIIAITSPRQPVIEATPRLARLPFWGQSDLLDVDITIEDALKDLQLTALDRIWLKGVGRAFAGPILAELGPILQARPKRLTEIAALLPTLEQRPVDPPRALPWADSTPPTEAPNRERWAAGLLVWRNQCGYVQAPALDPSEAALARRLWAGQLSVIWPLVAQVHAAICEVVAERHPRIWARRDAEIEHQIGPLAHFVAVNRGALGAAGHRLKAAAHAWKDIRNDLAHARPIRYEQLQDGIERWQAVLALEAAPG